MRMRVRELYRKKRKGGKYPSKVILVASVVFWIIALMLYIQIR